MAVVQYSALVTQLRGKLGGSQFNKGHNVQTLQRKSTPTIRQTPAQLAQRQRVSRAQRAWKTETIQRQQEAAQAALSNPVTNRLGQQVTLTGYNQYIKIMTWRLMGSLSQGSAPLADPIYTLPLPPARVEFPDIEITFLGMQPDGSLRFHVSTTKVFIGSVVGLANRTRAYVFLTIVNENGSRMAGSRPFFLFFTNANSSPITGTEFFIESSVYVHSGAYVLLEARTRNILAGGEVGYSSKVIQLL